MDKIKIEIDSFQELDQVKAEPSVGLDLENISIKPELEECELIGKFKAEESKIPAPPAAPPAAVATPASTSSAASPLASAPPPQQYNIEGVLEFLRDLRKKHDRAKLLDEQLNAAATRKRALVEELSTVDEEIARLTEKRAKLQCANKRHF